MTSANYTAVKALLRADPLTAQQAGSLAELLNISAPNQKLLTDRAIADRLEVSERQVQRWAKEGHLQPVRLGRRCVRYTEADLVNFIAARGQGPEGGRADG